MTYYTKTEFTYKVACQSATGELSINVRPFGSKEEAQQEADILNRYNTDLGHHYVIGMKSNRPRVILY